MKYLYIPMKKYIYIAFLALLAVSTFTSCKKCTKCKVTYTTPKKDGSTGYEHPELCGTKIDVENEETNFNNAYKVEGAVTCERTK